MLLVHTQQLIGIVAHVETHITGIRPFRKSIPCMFHSRHTFHLHAAQNPSHTFLPLGIVQRKSIFCIRLDSVIECGVRLHSSVQDLTCLVILDVRCPCMDQSISCLPLGE